MDIKKLALFFAFAFFITGIVVYQVRTTRSKTVAAPTAAVNPAPVAVAAAPLVAQVNPASLPTVPIKEGEGTAPRPATGLPALSIPTNGWGRSPFLTVEELRKLNEPAAPAPVIQEPVATAPVVEPLPHYVFQGIQVSRSNKTAYINDKAFRVGDRIGNEVVKDIKDNSVILENSDGKTRELSRKTNPLAEQFQPKGE
jgi:hypothetical protein